MQTDILQIGLAGLIHCPDALRGWETDLRKRLGAFPDGFDEILELAAHLSAGVMEGQNRTDGLQTIFDRVSLSDGGKQGSAPHFYAPASLALTPDALFPTDKTPDSKQPAISDQLQMLKQALPEGDHLNESFLEAVLAVMHRMASHIPSGKLPDVSLYEQQRMTSALSICLLKMGSSNIKESLTSLKTGRPNNANEPIALLVGGDISGIQSFIYTVTAKGAAKTLRGRSFYLQLLTEAVLRFVLADLQIPYTNVIYSGGGHFFLLAPLSKADRLHELQRRISEILLRHHGTSVYLALGSSVVPLNGFLNGNFPEYWGKMHASLAHQKQHRYSELGTDAYRLVFDVKEFGGNPSSTCDVCGEDFRKTQKWDELPDQDRICSLCYSFFDDLGRRFPESNFVALGLESTPRKTEDVQGILSEFGLTFQLLEDASETVKLQSRRIVLWALDDPDRNNWPSSNGAPQWLRYTANRVSQSQFDNLQKSVKGGFERLGVLRMDVDSLGDLFKRGLGTQATITRLATLSSKVSLFFEGWLKRLCETEERKGLIYTVYAGGDDIFLLGPWDVIPALAQDIVQDFNAYTGANSDVHLSAGLAFIDGKYPVYQAAEDAREAIEHAKAAPGKNAFTFLGKAWSWAVFDDLAGKQSRLETIVSSREVGGKDGPQSILQILQGLALEEDQHDRKNGRHVWGRWIWMGMYQLTRMQERYKDFASDIQSIRDELKENQYGQIDQWGTAARWTELKERRKIQKEAAK